MKLRLTTLMTGLVMANVVSAATPIDLRHQPASFLQHTMMLQTAPNAKTAIIKVSTDVDANQTAHTRIQQTYAGIPVWDAAGVIHTPHATAQTNRNLLASINNNATMNGIIYDGLEKDLAATPRYALTDAQKDAALQTAKTTYAKQMKLATLNSTHETVNSIVFVDNNHQAHYAYHVSFSLDDGKSGAHRPAFIIDATNLKIYRQWEQVLTENSQVLAGGIGGNEKMGERIYDNGDGNLPAAFIMRDSDDLTCTFNTKDIVVKDAAYDNTPVTGGCIDRFSAHKNIAWLSLDENDTRWKADQVNGGYSPTLDAFYNATIVKNLYADWYHIPALIEKDHKTPMKMVLRVHYGRNYDNAFWDGYQMTFGDGGELFYPLTTLDVTAHEMSHGFTSQHSEIDYAYMPMAALHEAFSDMAAAAAEYYTTGRNSWAVGADVVKSDGPLGNIGVIRYANDPTKDGKSIDNFTSYTSDMYDPHLVAGIYTKAFYLLATSKGWNIHRAFDVMVNANMHYWNPSMRLFQEAACGVIYATRDLAQQNPSYDVNDVATAFKQVGIPTSDC